MREIIKLADKEEIILPIKGIGKKDKTVILVEANKQRHKDKTHSKLISRRINYFINDIHEYLNILKLFVKLSNP